ncbi:MAG: gliding motility-associated C-terminal domain-containing protein [Spirochaetaceae bacterium]|jgi:flagellar hook assembly protein FlgD|nr:gliding motility-associated C-terminal domain-containing protein [Spirochaetaceae bacterium]
MVRKPVFVLAALLLTGAALYAQLPDIVFGADALEHFYSPALAGQGAFSTVRGNAHAAAVNPASAGDAQRITVDTGYLLLSDFGSAPLGHAVNFGLLVPAKFGVFGGSANYLYTPFDWLLNASGHHIRGNLFLAKDLYPGLTAGLGFNLGTGAASTISGDLGIRYNTGNWGKWENMTFAFTMKSMGKSEYPQAFTPVFGARADILHLRGNGDTADPLVVSAMADLAFPSLHNAAFKIGAEAVLAEMVTLTVTWGVNGAENIWGGASGAASRWPPLPSLGIGLNFVLKTGGRRIMGGRLPSDGDVTLNLALRPVSGPVYALGAGATWFIGVTDKTPPSITVDYPAAVYFSPNNDGLADALEVPIRITDQRYVNEWVFEIRNADGEVARTYRNKEVRPEAWRFKDIMLHLVQVKAGVEIPARLRWDGTLDSGELAPDETYTFTVTAADDNGNRVTTASYTVILDNTPPLIEITPVAENARIFSPDGDGSKDTLTIVQRGSVEARWEAAIVDNQGGRIKTFVFENGAPETILWDGTGDDGRVVPDGVYRYVISAADQALNRSEAALENIIVNTIQPAVTLTIADAFFSPNGDGVKDTMIFTTGIPVREGITGWAFEVRDGKNTARRTVSPSAPLPPARLEFDGTDDAGTALPEGAYMGVLSVQYRNGYAASASSPVFTLDITPPVASVSIPYDAFSPNNDGNQDVMIFLQEGSPELVWAGTVRAAESGETAVRTVRTGGVPPARFEWDGRNDGGALAPDGGYTYRLSATDAAGNSGSSNTVRFTLSTADTPVFITTDLRAFSPNGDGVKDSITVLPQIRERTGISSYQIAILAADGAVVRSFEGQNRTPEAVSWNGRDAGGAVARDGVYTARITVHYAAGNQPAAVSQPFTVNTAAPRAEVSAPYTVFSPNGDGNRDALPLNIKTEGDDEWTAEITGSGGALVRRWTWSGAAPALEWDGNDTAGNAVPDGTYRLTVSAVNEAGNSTRRTIDTIQLDARVPRIFLTASDTGIAPGKTGSQPIRFGLVASIRDGIQSWTLELKRDAGPALRTWPENAATALPETILWDGRDAAGAVTEGRYTPVLTVHYIKGDRVTAEAPPVIVDISGPELTFRAAPDYFSPDNDGIDDELTMFLIARDASPIAAWSLEIREPEPPNQVFYRIEGRGAPAERTRWDGRSSRGELVQSASDYPAVFRAVDALGNESVLETKIGVDVLVIREGDRLRIQIPSIVFRPSAADFNGLPQETVDNNNRILRRIAQILNKFRDYRVEVEGHANPVLRTEAEEREELQPLSNARARFTVDALAGFGVARNRLRFTGAGGTRPVVDPGDQANRWKNRRVEFLLIR